MLSNIHTACTQWSNRPTEERYRTLEDMQAMLDVRRERSSVTEPVQLASCTVQDCASELAVVNGYGSGLLNHFTLQQLASGIGAPAPYLRSLPTSLAAQCLTSGLSRYTEKDRCFLTSQTIDNHTQLRAITSEKYSRYWDSEVLRDLTTALSGQGWRVPPARPYPGCPSSHVWRATSDDVLPNGSGVLSIREGDLIGPAGLYASDRDMFIFLVNQQRAIKTPYCDTPLFRAIFVQNSEVGASAYKVSLVLYDSVCGNHILWSAIELAEIRVVHRGRYDDTARISGQASLNGALQAIEDSSSYGEERTISIAHNTPIKVERIAQVAGLPLGTAKAAVGKAEDYLMDNGGRPHTVWGAVQGLTRLSQESRYTADRHHIDKGAGRLLSSVKSGAVR
jgi:hypothetical protein